MFFIGLMTMVYLSMTSFAYGAKDNKGYLNGRPFSDLARHIAENRDAISELETTTSELRTDLDALTVEMMSVKARLLANETRIADLEGQMLEVRADLNSSFIEIEKIRSELAGLKSNVAENLALILELDDAMTANLAAILDLDSNVAANLAAILGLDSDVATNLSTIMNLDGTVSENISAIRALNLEMTLLESRLDDDLDAFSNLLAQMNWVRLFYDDLEQQFLV